MSHRADFCVGYFNLRGWKAIDGLVDRWPGGEGSCCRLLVGMQLLPKDPLRDSLSLLPRVDCIDLQTAVRFKRRLADDFKEQLTLGAPTAEDDGPRLYQASTATPPRHPRWRLDADFANESRFPAANSR